MHHKKGPQRLLGEVQMYRIRVATAESKLKLLRAEAREARRRRKAAKRAAQRARKQFQSSKADLVQLNHALAQAEAKFFEAGGRALSARIRKAATKGTARPVTQAKAPAPARAVPTKPDRKRRKTVASRPGRLAAPKIETLLTRHPSAKDQDI